MAKASHTAQVPTWSSSPIASDGDQPCNAPGSAGSSVSVELIAGT
jgi:hypothetical protein